MHVGVFVIGAEDKQQRVVGAPAELDLLGPAGDLVEEVVLGVGDALEDVVDEGAAVVRVEAQVVG